MHAKPEMELSGQLEWQSSSSHCWKLVKFLEVLCGTDQVTTGNGIIPAVLPKWEYILHSIGRSLALHLQTALQPRDNRKWNHNSWPARRPDLFSSPLEPRGNSMWKTTWQPEMESSDLTSRKARGFLSPFPLPEIIILLSFQERSYRKEKRWIRIL